MLPRLMRVMHAKGTGIWAALKWVVSSREDTNFTYELAPENLAELTAFVAKACGCPDEVARGYIDEAREDANLAKHIVATVKGTSLRYVADPRADFGRRLAWYALIRVMEPRLVVETGVDKGLGSVLICAALERNSASGHPGRYVGIDIEPGAGELLRGRYADFGEVICDDAITALLRLDGKIDLLISDCDHAEEYEEREFECVLSRLVNKGMIISDNAHATDTLKRFAGRNNLQFGFFRERPLGHWYGGAGLGIAVQREAEGEQ